MARILWLATMVVLVAALIATMAPPVGRIAAAGEATATPTVTLYPCPVPTIELIRVEPVTSPTELMEQTINVRLNNGDAVTVTLESGTFSRVGSSVFHVPVALLPNTTHHLSVMGHVRRIVVDHCVYGDYNISTTIDRYGRPLVIQQIMPLHYPYFLPLVVQAP